MNKILAVSPEDLVHTDTSILITATCGHSAWVSEAGQAVMADGEVDTICLRCLPTEGIEFGADPRVTAELAGEIGAKNAQHFQDNIQHYIGQIVDQANQKRRWFL